MRTRHDVSHVPSPVDAVRAQAPAARCAHDMTSSTYLVLQMRVEREHLLPDALADGVLKRLVIVTAFLDALVLPLLKPLPTRQRDHRAYTLACREQEA